MERRTLSFHVDPPLYDALVEAAAERGFSTSELCRVLLKDAIARLIPADEFRLTYRTAAEAEEARRARELR